MGHLAQACVHIFAFNVFSFMFALELHYLSLYTAELIIFALSLNLRKMHGRHSFKRCIVLELNILLCAYIKYVYS